MSIRILLAGENLSSVESTRDAIEPLDCLLIKAPSSALALYLANKNFPDLILCNPQMLDGSGMEFLTQIKADPQLSGIPFVFVCPRDLGPKFYAQALRQGAAEVIVEPGGGAGILNELKPHLRKRGLEREPESPE